MTALRLSMLPAAVALAASLASAQDLYLGSRTTQVTHNDPLDGAATLVGLCGGQVQSMTTLGGEVLIGDLNGNVYRHVPSTGAFGYAFTAANDAAALAAHGAELLVGGSDGTILRYDPASGSLLGSLSVGLPVEAMTMANGQLLVGSVSGLIQAGDPLTGGFQFWATCGNDVSAMASDGDELFVADIGGGLWRFEVVTQGLVATFSLPAEGSGLAFFDGDVIASCVDGSVLRLSRFTGATKSAFQAGFAADALALLEHPAPGTAYCFGVVCPCGNNDAENGCVNSTGFGGALLASGTASVAADDLELSAYDLPEGSIARFYMGPQQISIPFKDGLLCAGNGAYPTFRFPAASTGPKGILRLGPGIVDYSDQNFGLGLIAPGVTWNFQAWTRDPTGPCGQTVNTSSAYSVVFLP